MWFHFNIYRQQKEKGKKKKETKAVRPIKIPHTSYNITMEVPYEEPPQAWLQNLLYPPFLFHYIILIDKAIETLAQS